MMKTYPFRWMNRCGIIQRCRSLACAAFFGVVQWGGEKQVKEAFCMGWKPLPIGVDNFKKIIEEGYFYVDKTLMKNSV